MCYLIFMIRATSDSISQEKPSSYLTSAHSYPPLHKNLVSNEVPQIGKR